MSKKVGWFGVSCLIALLLAGCPPEDSDKSAHETGSADAGESMRTTTSKDAGSSASSMDAGMQTTDSDAGLNTDAETVIDPGPVESARCPLDQSKLKPASVWTKNWSKSFPDPQGDDKGMGSYAYPSAGSNGAADIRNVDLKYDLAKQELTITVGVTVLAPETRIGIILWDRPSFEAELDNIDWALSGVELRVPDWSKSGVATVLALPKASNPTYDTTRKLTDGKGSRPDNAIFTRTRDLAGNPDVQWIQCDGTSGNQPTNIMELGVTADRKADPNTLSFTIPAGALAPYMSTSAGSLAVVVYGFLVVAEAGDKLVNEYGAYEIPGTLGGVLESAEGDRAWRDPDAYDIAFVDLVANDGFSDSLMKQSKILSPPAPAGTSAVDVNTNVVVLTKSSEGVGIVDTTGGI